MTDPDVPPPGRSPAPQPSGRADLLLEGLLHPGEVDRFVAGARPTAPAELAGLRLRVLAYLARIQAIGESRPQVDVETATSVAWVLATLCDEPDQLGDDQRALLRGAVEYFVLDDDELSDTDDVIGFDDDARVVNAVTAALGRRDLRIDP